MYSLGSTWQYGSIASDNGLAPGRRQAIIESNVVLLHWRMYASLGLNGLFNGIVKITIDWKDVASFIRHPLDTETDMVRKN